MTPARYLLNRIKSRRLYILAEREFMAVTQAWSQAFCILPDNNHSEDWK